MKTSTLSRARRLTLAAAALLAAFFAVRPAHAADGDDRPLPRYFDQLALTDGQLRQVHAIQDQYDPEIAAKKELLAKLRRTPFATSVIISVVRVIKDLQARRHDALLGVLDDEQRQKLQDLLSGANDGEMIPKTGF